MTADVSEETPNQNEEDSTPELSLADHEDALKKSRWNVFMYLGIAALLFGFALYPFMTVDLSVDEGIGSIDKTVTVWGLPVDGEDFTDIPVKTTVIVQAVPTDVDSIEIFMIENPKGCDVTDGSIGNMRVDLQNGDAKHPNKYHLIENPVESQVYDVEFGVDPGIYCLQVVVSTQSQNYGGINVNSETDIYPTQMPLAIIATLCLAMSAFAFIGAQKHGRFVKSLVEPKMTPTIEDTVLADATTQKIAAGPQGPPSGPTGPPTGPTGPPTGPTVQQVRRQVQQALHSLYPLNKKMLLSQLSNNQPHNLNRHQNKMSMKIKGMVGSLENSQTVPTIRQYMLFKMANMSRMWTLTPELWKLDQQTYLPLKELDVSVTFDG